MKILRRIKQILKKQESIDFESIIKRYKDVKSSSKRVVICPENTDENWLGIKNATIALYKSDVLVLPQFYSNQVISDKQFKIFLHDLKKNRIEKIIFSGLPNYFYKFIEFSKEQGFQVAIHFHGGLAEINGNSEKQKQMSRLITFAQKGVINEIIVVKEGLDSLFSKLTNLKVKRIVPELFVPENIQPIKFSDDKIHIGVFGNNSYNKNRHVQIAAASMIDNSIIHIISPNEFDYLLPAERIVIHDHLNRDEFLKVLGGMDVNLYCSYSESWGQVILESFALKTPCFFANNAGLSTILDSNLNEFCISEFDNPKAIADKVLKYLNAKSKPQIDIEKIKENIQRINTSK